MKTETETQEAVKWTSGPRALDCNSNSVAFFKCVYIFPARVWSRFPLATVAFPLFHSIVHCGHYQPWASGPELYKEVS